MWATAACSSARDEKRAIAQCFSYANPLTKQTARPKLKHDDHQKEDTCVLDRGRAQATTQAFAHSNDQACNDGAGQMPQPTNDDNGKGFEEKRYSNHRV